VAPAEGDPPAPRFLGRLTGVAPVVVTSSMSMDVLRAAREADVYKAGRRAATLTRTADGVELRYLDEWISERGPAVAMTLPVNDTPVLRVGGALPAYFAGLLPEGRRLGALRRAVKTSADDELSLLLAIGQDTIGDVQVVESGTTPGQVEPEISLEHLDRIRFTDILVRLGIQPQRVGLPGVQDKTSAMITVPVDQGGERYILKLDPVEYPHLVENEAFFLDAARRSGLSVPPSVVVRDADGKPGLLVRRFDRITVDGTVRALAVEDGCQACNRPPADKYLLDADEVFTALAAVCDARVLAGRELVRQLAFSYLIGNGDAHAKNFSVLQALDGEWRVSPLYDVPSSQPYGDTTMAMTIAGGAGPDFGIADFVALGAHLAVPEKAVRGTLTELAERVDLWSPGLDNLPFNRAKITKLRRVIEYRRKRLVPPPPGLDRRQISGPVAG
jgi:serine/threonine-protein kinase HipA